MDELARVGVDLLEEPQQFAGPHRRTASSVRADRVVRAKDVLGAGQLGQFVEDRQQVIAVGQLGVAAEYTRARRVPAASRLARPRDLRRVDQAVVLQEPHEDTGKHPGSSRLRDGIAPPVLEVLCRSLGFLARSYSSRSRWPTCGTSADSLRWSRSSSSRVSSFWRSESSALRSITGVINRLGVVAYGQPGKLKKSKNDNQKQRLPPYIPAMGAYRFSRPNQRSEMRDCEFIMFILALEQVLLQLVQILIEVNRD